MHHRTWVNVRFCRDYGHPGAMRFIGHEGYDGSRPSRRCPCRGCCHVLLLTAVSAYASTPMVSEGAYAAKLPAARNPLRRALAATIYHVGQRSLQSRCLPGVQEHAVLGTFACPLRLNVLIRAGKGRAEDVVEAGRAGSPSGRRPALPRIVPGRADRFLH